MASLTFYGAVGTVTGSRFLLELDGKKMLFDCGMFQGTKENRLRNWDTFQVPAAEIDRVFISHAHIDHSGYLPRLCKDGFSGPVHMTDATADLCAILLRDSGHIQEEDAAWANKQGFSKHDPALPLYTVSDAETAIEQFRPLYYGENLHIDDTTRVKYRDAGHILGSGHIDLKTTRNGRTRKIVFSGDYGRPDQPVLRDPAQVFNVDYLVLESTYGNRLHDATPPAELLARYINEGLERGGVILIPSFAVGRTQSLLYILRELEERKAIPELPVYVDSPMSARATDVFKDHIADMDITSRTKTVEGTKIFKTKHLQFCHSRRDSMALNEINEGAIIISSSGMVTGGRILHHMIQKLRNPAHTVLFIGYQAEGTRGRAILEGAESVKIHGTEVPVRAHIEHITGFSGHGDYNEILAWLMGFNRPPEKTFIVHGEPEASASLAEKIQERFGWDVTIPGFQDSFELDL